VFKAHTSWSSGTSPRRGLQLHHPRHRAREPRLRGGRELGHPALTSPSCRRRATGSKTLFATEVYTTNGPFDRPQDYIRFNVFARRRPPSSENVDARRSGVY
jgi:hypothetical protein